MTDTHPQPKDLTPEQVTDMFTAHNAAISQGKEAQAQRERLIKDLYAADPKKWTQARLAKEAGISQAAVSKLLGKQYAFDWEFNGGFAYGRVRAADLDEAVELALKAGQLERGAGDFDDPEDALYLDGNLVVRGASEPRAGSWATVYEPEIIRAHRPR